MQPTRVFRPATFLVATVLMAGATISFAAVAARDDMPVSVDLVDVTRGYADLAEAVMPAVVNVQVEGERDNRAPAFPPGMERFFERFGMPLPDERQRQMPSRGEGSGFVIDAEGHIVTNAHVVGGASEITVTLHDGVALEAELVGMDEKTDLAVLKVDADQPLPYVGFADSDEVRVGERVVAVGNPFGLGGTVTAGIVSAKGREIGAGPYDDFFQIDAAINRGNSGGPAFNLEGEVIGVNSMIYSPSGGSVGIGFAIAANLAADVVNDLLDDGLVERGWLGVSIQGLDDDIMTALGLNNDHGALVSQVLPNSPAATAGIRAGDVIVGLGDLGIERVRDLTRAVAAASPGSHINVEVIREGERQVIDVAIGRLDADDRQAAAKNVVPEQPMLGLALAPLTPELRQDLGLEPGASGVVVTGVSEGSPAASKGIRRGDVILRFGDVDADSPETIAAEARKAVEAGETQALLLLAREGQQLFRAVPFDLS